MRMSQGYVLYIAYIYLYRFIFKTEEYNKESFNNIVHHGLSEVNMVLFLRNK